MVLANAQGLLCVALKAGQNALLLVDHWLHATFDQRELMIVVPTDTSSMVELETASDVVFDVHRPQKCDGGVADCRNPAMSVCETDEALGEELPPLHRLSAPRE